MRFHLHTPIAPDAWQRLEQLRRHLAEMPACELEQGISSVLELLAELCEASPGFVVLAKLDRSAGDDDPLCGWRPVKMIFAEAMDEAARAAAQPDPEVYLNDPLVAHVVRTAGKPRVYRDRALHEEFGWGETPTSRLLDSVGIVDRMVGVYPVDADTEVYVTIEAVGREPLSEAEADFYWAAIASMQRTLCDLARLYGLLDATKQLSPRERDILRYLLMGHAEKSIAQETGLTAAYTHQCVVQIFRKFGVSSRAALMALWINGSAKASTTA